ncbi:MAG: hypothetical protein QM692_13130 [Thermomicrobiales bacterium]
MDHALFDRLTLRLRRRAIAPALAALALPALAPTASGKKKKKCKPPKRRCGKRCLAVQTDPANCGDCGRACAAGETCSGGACVAPQPTCPAGQKACNGGCIPATNCCTSADCTGGEVCRADVCIDGVCTLVSKAEGIPCPYGGGVVGDCRGGTCSLCLARQSSCSSANQCCGGTTGMVTCYTIQHAGFVCDVSDPRCGGQLGATCSVNCDCLNGLNCENGACCVVNGRGCTTSADCCGSLTCQGGVCN